jgi:hypothetical protein
MRAQEGAAACVPTNETRGRATPRVGAGTVDLSYVRIEFKCHFCRQETNSYVREWQQPQPDTQPQQAMYAEEGHEGSRGDHAYGFLLTSPQF